MPKNNHENRAKLAKYVVKVADMQDIIDQRIQELMHQFQSCQEDFEDCAFAYPEVFEEEPKSVDPFSMPTKEASDE